jgi:hypothetical protein
LHARQLPTASDRLRTIVWLLLLLRRRLLLRHRLLLLVNRHRRRLSGHRVNKKVKNLGPVYRILDIRALQRPPLALLGLVPGAQRQL